MSALEEVRRNLAERLSNTRGWEETRPSRQWVDQSTGFVVEVGSCYGELRLTARHPGRDGRTVLDLRMLECNARQLYSQFLNMFYLPGRSALAV